MYFVPGRTGSATTLPAKRSIALADPRPTTSMRVSYSFPHKLGADRICYTAWQQVNGLAAAGAEVHAFPGALHRRVPRHVVARPTLASGKAPSPVQSPRNGAYLRVARSHCRGASAEAGRQDRHRPRLAARCAQNLEGRQATRNPDRARATECPHPVRLRGRRQGMPEAWRRVATGPRAWDQRKEVHDRGSRVRSGGLPLVSFGLRATDLSRPGVSPIQAAAASVSASTRPDSSPTADDANQVVA